MEQVCKIACIGLIAGTSLSFINHNVIGNDERDGLKIIKIGQSAAKGRTGQGSTIISRKESTNVNSIWKSPNNLLSS